MRIGVLAIQGDFELHLNMLKKLGVEGIAVRSPEQLRKCEGLIVPGGESTTFVKLLKENDLDKEIAKFGRKNQIMGTCAGLITLARNVKNSAMETLNLIDIEVERNAYGRQVDSFIDEISTTLKEENDNFEAVFIRAPKITKVGKGIKTLGFHKDNIVLAENDTVLVATFHPELTDDTRIHDYFISKIKARQT